MNKISNCIKDILFYTNITPTSFLKNKPEIYINNLLQ